MENDYLAKSIHGLSHLSRKKTHSIFCFKLLQNSITLILGLSDRQDRQLEEVTLSFGTLWMYFHYFPGIWFAKRASNAIKEVNQKQTDKAKASKRRRTDRRKRETHQLHTGTDNCRQVIRDP